MKRVGYIYEQMSDWSNIVDAEMTATKRKLRNPGVIRHVGNRIRNLCEIQRHVINCDMRTDEYIHEMRVSGQGKVRDIAKLHFHPSHIQHQLLVQCGERRAERAFIRHTYASRKGYGQIKCANAIRKAISKYDPNKRWYCQMDIVKYYHNIPHAHIEQCLRRLYKDEKYIQAMLEPFHRFSADGKAVPLGIRPSQLIGNICLSGFDHFMTEENKCEDYIRYLDDTFFTGASKGEVRRKYKRAKKYLERLGFSLHEPKIHRICEGIDMMGFVMYGNNGDMWWRKSNKVKWLRSRAKVTNRKRLLELDCAAWGMLKHGNRHCRKLFYKVTGRRTGRKNDKDMVNISKCNIKRQERLDEHGKPFFDAPRINMQLILGKRVVVDKIVSGIKTKQGEGRYALRVQFMGDSYKLIVNAVDIKNFLADMERCHVTKFSTVFVDNGSMHYSVDEKETDIIEVCGRTVKEQDGHIIYEDDGTEVIFE